MFCQSQSQRFPAGIRWLSVSHKRAKPKIGLALGGGGARGLAHIGVIRKLEEFGVQVAVKRAKQN